MTVHPQFGWAKIMLTVGASIISGEPAKVATVQEEVMRGERQDLPASPKVPPI